MELNAIKFNQTVQAAIARAPQMAKHIEVAADNLLSNPYIHDDGDALLILSDSGNIYRAKSQGKGYTCNCKASHFNQTCWHRLADRLYRLYLSKRGN